MKVIWIQSAKLRAGNPDEMVNCRYSSILLCVMGKIRSMKERSLE